MYVGSWEYVQMKACELPLEVAEAFEEATKELEGVTYVPVLYMAKQVVAGTNYLLVCKGLTLVQPTKEGCFKIKLCKPLHAPAYIDEIQPLAQ